MATKRPTLRYLAGALIAASVLSGIIAICARAGMAGAAIAKTLEGAALFLAAAAYLAHSVAHHERLRELLPKLILISAFAGWGVVQVAPGLPSVPVLNDIVIVLFVVDLAFIVSPWK
jgi:hypothetical protein